MYPSFPPSFLPHYLPVFLSSLLLPSSIPPYPSSLPSSLPLPISSFPLLFSLISLLLPSSQCRDTDPSPYPAPVVTTRCQLDASAAVIRSDHLHRNRLLYHYRRSAYDLYDRFDLDPAGNCSQSLYYHSTDHDTGYSFFRTSRGTF